MLTFPFFSSCVKLWLIILKNIPVTKTYEAKMKKYKSLERKERDIITKQKESYEANENIPILTRIINAYDRLLEALRHLYINTENYYDSLNGEMIWDINDEKSLFRESKFKISLLRNELKELTDILEEENKVIFIIIFWLTLKNNRKIKSNKKN